MSVLLLHRLGFHGRHWSAAYWHLGNIFVCCRVCGRQQQLSPEDAALIPPNQITGNVDDMKPLRLP